VVSEAPAAEDTVILSETGAKNLRIETEVVEEGDFEETAFALGRLEIVPGREAVVSSRIPGRVESLLVAPGDLVEVGQVIAKIESRQPGDPPPVVALKAPLRGTILSVSIRIGESVEPDRALVEIADLTELSAIARVPETLAGRIRPNSEANIRVTAVPGETFRGTPVRVGTVVDAASATLDTHFRVTNEGARLRPGMRAEFGIVLAKRENVMRVPRSALQGESGNRFLYVKHFDLPNAFTRTPVEIGAMNDRYVEILSGLFPADEVVTRGAYSLSFAGGSSGISLKEALDAAHGHEHAADGSELTPEKRAEQEAGKTDHDHDHEDHDHDDPVSEGNHGGHLWQYVSAVLFVLLLASFFGRPTRAAVAPVETAAQDPSAET